MQFVCQSKSWESEDDVEVEVDDFDELNFHYNHKARKNQLSITKHLIQMANFHLEQNNKNCPFLSLKFNYT